MKGVNVCQTCSHFKEDHTWKISTHVCMLDHDEPEGNCDTPEGDCNEWEAATKETKKRIYPMCWTCVNVDMAEQFVVKGCRLSGECKYSRTQEVS